MPADEESNQLSWLVSSVAFLTLCSDIASTYQPPRQWVVAESNWVTIDEMLSQNSKLSFLEGQSFQTVSNPQIYPARLQKADSASQAGESDTTSTL